MINCGAALKVLTRSQGSFALGTRWSNWLHPRVRCTVLANQTCNLTNLVSEATGIYQRQWQRYVYHVSACCVMASVNYVARY